MVAAPFYTGLLRAKRAMAICLTLVSSESRFNKYSKQGYSNSWDNSDKIPVWARDEEDQKTAWEAVAKELEAIEPGCLKKILEI